MLLKRQNEQEVQSQLVGYRWSITKKPKRLEKLWNGQFVSLPDKRVWPWWISKSRKRRKHVNAKPSWFFYFDEKPNSKEITDSLKVARTFPLENTIQDQTSETKKHAVKLLSSFSLSCDIGEVLTKWSTGGGGSGGGCKKDRTTETIVTRCFQFVRFSCKDEEELTFDVVDFSLCFPNLLVKFIKVITRRMETWTWWAFGLYRCYFWNDRLQKTSKRISVSSSKYSSLQQSCTSKEHERQLQRWWNCSGHTISTLRH